MLRELQLPIVYGIEEQAQLFAAHIRSRLIMRLGLCGLAALFVVVATLLVVSAPDGREMATSIIAAALFALAVELPDSARLH